MIFRFFTGDFTFEEKSLLIDNLRVLFNTWGKQGLRLNQENVTLKRYTLLKYKKKGYS